MSFGSDGLPNEKEIVKANIKRYPVLCSRDQALINLVLSVIISWAASEKSCKLPLFTRPIRNTLDNQAFCRYSSSLHGKPGLFNTLRACGLKPGFPGFPGYSEPGLPGKPWLTRLFAHMVSLV